MNVQWYGHSCFLLTDSAGKRLLIDPYNDSVGYPVVPIEADVVVSTHRHLDHAYFNRVRGDYVLCNEASRYEAEGFSIEGIACFHDDVQGAKRGNNIIFVIERGGVRVAHCGDLGHLLEKKHLDRLQNIDLLMLPVGGYYTIDAEFAKQVAEQIKPAHILPMHFRLPGSKQPITGPEPFLGLFSGQDVAQVGNLLTLPYAGSQKVLVMEPVEEAKGSD
jgi:L-ascorbate metabolism protein UlaG (beta-lactamase superfamily)